MTGHAKLETGRAVPPPLIGVAVAASPWDHDGRGRRLVRLEGETTARAPSRSALMPYRHRVVVERESDGSTQFVEVVGMVGGSSGSSYLYADVMLSQGDYWIKEPGLTGYHTRFRLPSAPGAPVMLCPHAGARPSTIGTRLLFDERHQPAWGDQRFTMRACCREQVASWLEEGNRYGLTIFRPEVQTLEIKWNGKNFAVKPGEYLVFNPSDTGNLTGHQRWPVTYATLVVGQSALRQAREAIGLSKALGPFDFQPGPHTPGPELRQAFALWDSAHDLSGGVGGESLVQSAGQALIVCLLQTHPNGLRDRATRRWVPRASDSRLETIVAYLQEHFHRPLEMKRMAGEHGVSARWLNDQFRVRVGKTPVEYILDLRVERALILLKDSTQKIEAIAHAVGYRDVRAFNRMFKARLAQTPRMLRGIPR